AGGGRRGGARARAPRRGRSRAGGSAGPPLPELAPPRLRHGVARRPPPRPRAGARGSGPRPQSDPRSRRPPAATDRVPGSQETPVQVCVAGRRRVLPLGRGRNPPPSCPPPVPTTPLPGGRDLLLRDFVRRSSVPPTFDR